MVTQRKLRVALIGLGRLGQLRAKILAFQQPRIELVAACDTKPGAEKWMSNLPPTVQFYADPEDCMRNSGAEAVLISTATATHAPLICLALDLDLHVMCEKPISTDLAATAAVIAKAESKPHLKFLVPFTRRYDDSHQAVKIMADAGSLGEVHAVEATCVDVQDPNAFFVAFSPFSGGLFLDCGIHVVDVGRWYLEVASGISNPLKQCRRVVGMGQTAVYSDLQQFGDADNAWGMVEFENGSVLTMHLSRTSTNGFEASTRVHGTKSHALINGNSALNRVELRDAYGVRITNPQDAFTLYDKTFVSDLAEFATGVLDGRPFSCNPEDAYEAGKIAIALQHSFRTGEPVYFDEEGQPILKAMDANGHSSGVVKAANGHVNGVKKVANGITNGVANGIVNGH